jgi:uncharacterized membrane protein
MDAAAQYAMAYALTTSAGIRALLPLALFSIAAHLGYVHPPQSFAWLGSTPVTIVLIAVAVAELLADKVPLLDHALHVVQIVVKPAAAAVLVAGTAHPQNPDVLVGLMILGALNALGVHAISASTRVGSTATTAGLGNPVLSTGEDAAAFGTTLLAFFAPFAAAALALFVGATLFFVVRAIFRRPRRAVR